LALQIQSVEVLEVNNLAGF